MFRKLVLLLVSSAGCFVSSVFAVGLGEYELKSGLNQVLKAEIRLLSAGDLGEHEIHASLASVVEFEKVGIERQFFLNGIRFETKREDNGLVIIHLTTTDPIKEPFLNFLVELNWPNGRIIREYTFLLDPPVFDESTSSTIQQTQTTTQAEPQAPQSRNTRPKARQVAQPSFSGTSYGPVSNNDTLWSIASKVRPGDDVSIHQTLVAIYRANPEAFANGNINNLLSGKVLVIPEASLISQVPHRAALQDVVTQNRQWQSGGARRVVDGNKARKSATTVNGDPRLTLATPDANDSGGGVSGNVRGQLEQAQNELVRSQETSATLQAENDELRARLADALNKLESVQSESAVNITDTELAALAKSQAANDEITSPDSENPAATSNDITTNSTDELSTTPESDSGTIADNEVSNLADNTTETTSGGDTSVTESLKTPVAVQRPPEKGMLESILESSALVWGGGAAILLIVFGVFWRMRKRMEEEDFQDDLVASASAGTLDNTENFELPDVGDDMLVELDMEEATEDVPQSDDENFDPLGEADIYIAYGKYEQAESLLLEAIEDNPVRSDLKVKLMECYAESEDKENFESLAQEVSEAIDAEEWSEQVDALRSQTWSDTDEGSSESGEFDLPSTEDIFGQDDFDVDEDEDSTKELSDSDDELGDDFDLGDDDSDDEFDIEMDLNLDDDDSEEIGASEAVTTTFDALGEGELDDEVLDLDDGNDSFELDDSDDIALNIDDDEFDFDEDDSEFGDDDGADSGDEIATKLDLARAYIDMGDAEGAKEILSEVISEGTDEQKQEAQTLFDKAD